MKPSDLAMSISFLLLVFDSHFNAESLVLHVQFLAWLLARTGR